MYPRANALGLIMTDHYMLLEEQYGKHAKGTGYYYRPVGGTIEFGEKSDDTLVREFAEELGVKIIIKRYISCIENIFRIDKNIGHEITQLYLVDFEDETLYQKERFTVSEGEKTTYAKWIAMEEILSRDKVLYPDELIDLLGKLR